MPMSTSKRSKSLRRHCATACCAFALLAGGVAHASSYEDSLDAARMGATRQLAQLLERGIDPNTVDAQGNTLLMLAAREGHADTVALLLRHRPRHWLRNPAGDSALMLATLRGDVEVVDLLLRAGAEFDHEGWNPLLYAAFQGHLPIVERMIGLGANIDGLAPNQATALMLAARNGHTAVVRRLLQAGANVDRKNDAGLTADVWAEKSGNTDIAALIRAERARRQGQPVRP